MPKIALVQMATTSELSENLVKSQNMLRHGAAVGADLVLFPEIHLNPFFPKHSGGNADQYLLSLDSQPISDLCDACATAKILASPNLYLKENDERYDASLLIDRRGKILGVSKMVHITQAPGFYEQDYYTPSREGFKVYDTEIGRIGIIVCFDRHYAESFRACALQGADIILIPTANLKGEPLEMFEWELRVAAFQNSVFIAMCNRVGTEDGMIYCGNSIVVSPDGKVVHKMDDAEGVAIVDYDLEFVRDLRRDNAFLKLYSLDAFQFPQKQSGAAK